MKTLGTDTRFLALSATAPNVEDIATWLGTPVFSSFWLGPTP